MRVIRIINSPAPSPPSVHGGKTDHIGVVARVVVVANVDVGNVVVVVIVVVIVVVVVAVDVVNNIGGE